MKRDFSFYEFVGILSPGALILLFIIYLFPYQFENAEIKDISLGGISIFLILAYIIGHLIQALGNALEYIFWVRWGGKPTSWINANKYMYLTEYQLAALKERLAKLYCREGKVEVTDYSKKQWQAIVRQIYTIVYNNKAADRIDVFDGNYGLFRGMAAALLAGIIILIIRDGLANWKIISIGIALLAMSLYRMHRFARYYARELFLQYINLDVSQNKLDNS